MGAYFIRRKSRHGLYRNVLRRYVQMATKGGVTQAIFPEGGLSLDGGLQPPKLGLLHYIVDGLDLAARDVVFVPVGLNYDRVLEDRVLVAAARNGTRRFEARISHVAAATLKQLWLRATGRFHRFGYAAVSFGRPLSLRHNPGLATDPEALAGALMDRIATIVPVLPVPLVCHILQDGPMTRAAVDLAFATALDRLQDSHVHLPRNSCDYAVETGLRALIERGIAAESEGAYALQDRDLAAFYARSIAHLL